MVAALVLAACRDDGAVPAEKDTDPTAADDNGDDGDSDGDGDETGDDDDDDDDGPDDDGIVHLDPVGHLVRASMALRGVRPTLEEMDAVAADPDALDEIVASYVESDLFGTTIRDLHNEVLLTRASIRPDLFSFPILGLEYGADYDGGDLTRDVHEAPLRFIEHVVMDDHPYTEIVTADYTVANGPVARVWGFDVATDDLSWQITPYPGSRPAAGILSDSMLFHRYKSMPANANRARANAISTALLCEDFLSTSIELEGGIDLSDPDAVQQAVTNNPACTGCHDTLDPLASFFYGHVGFVLSATIGPNDNIPDAMNPYLEYPLPMYMEQLEPAWQPNGMPAPAYFGEAGDDLAELGQLIADDQRFSRCAVQNFVAYLAQRPRDTIDPSLVSELEEDFVASGYDAKQLALAIVHSDAFTQSYSDDADVAEELRGYQRARPRQVARMLEALTGVEWIWEDAPVLLGAPGGTTDIDLLGDSFFGFEALAGGTDSYYVPTVSDTSNPTTALVLDALAGIAAGHVVEDDFARPPEERRLLGGVEPETTDEATIRAALADVHALVLGERVGADDEALDPAWTLFDEVRTRTDSPTHAWKTTLTAMFQDPRVLHY